MKKMPVYAVALFLSLMTSSVMAADLIGKVVKIQDGDTITILDKNNTQHRIRLAQIDAPESNQPWGSKSKEYLNRRIAGKEVKVVSSGTDRYKRTIGTVFHEGVDICKEQVEMGNAWVYNQYATDRQLFVLQNQAVKNKLGLWKLPESERVEPWLWRKQKNAR